MAGRILLLLLVLAPAGVAGLKTSERKRVREVLTACLAEPDARRRAALVADLRAALPDASLEEIEAAVREGPLRTRQESEPRRGEANTVVGSVVVGYTFRHDGKEYRYAVDIPRAYDPAVAHAVLLDPGHGTGARHDDPGKADFLPFFRRQAPGEDWLVVRSEIVEQIGAGGRRGARPEEEGCRIFQELLRDLANRFHIDPDRIVVAGLSQTGFWAWVLAVNRPDRWAAVVPTSAISAMVEPYAPNLLNVSVFVAHGAEDSTCPVAQPRATLPLLARHGVRVRYVELPGAGHDAGVWSQIGPGIRWCLERPRVRYPRRISRALQTTQDGWCHWARIDRLGKEGSGGAREPSAAALDGEIDGQTVRLYSQGVERVTLCLASEMLDLDRPVTIVWNGKTVHEGIVQRDPAVLFELAREKTDWKATFEAAIGLKAP